MKSNMIKMLLLSLLSFTMFVSISPSTGATPPPPPIVVNKNAKNTTAYYYKFTKGRVVKLVDFNSDGDYEPISFEKYSGDEYIAILLNGKRVLSGWNIKSAALVDLQNNDKYIELFLICENISGYGDVLRIYRYNGKKFNIYATGDCKNRACPLNDCLLLSGAFFGGSTSIIPAKKYFTGKGTIKVPCQIKEAYLERVPGKPNIPDFMTVFKGTIIYRIKKGKLIGDTSKEYKNSAKNIVKLSGKEYKVEKIKFSGNYLYLYTYDPYTGRRATRKLKAKARLAVSYVRN